MATIFRRGDSDIYYCQFKYKKKPYRFSTRETDRVKANKFLQRKMAEVKGERGIEEMVTHIEELIEQMDARDREATRKRIANRIYRADLPELSIDKAWSTFIKQTREHDTGYDLMKIYEGYWGQFKKWISDSFPDIKCLHEISGDLGERLANKYKNHIKQNVSARTVNGKLKFMYDLFNSLRLEAGLKDNVWHKDKCKRLTEFPEGYKPLNAKEWGKVKELANQWTKTAEGGRAELHTAIMLGMYCGFRRKDACLLRWKEVEFKDRIIKHVVFKTKKTVKASKRKNEALVIPIADPLYRELRKAKRNAEPDAEYICPALAEQYIRNRDQISRWVKKVFEDCGIKTTEEPPEGRKRKIVRYSFHSFRETTATELNKMKVDPFTIQQVLGHADLDQTSEYVTINEKQKKAAMEALSDFGKKGGKK